MDDGFDQELLGATPNRLRRDEAAGVPGGAVKNYTPAHFESPMLQTCSFLANATDL